MNQRSSTHSFAIFPTLPLNVYFRSASKWKPFPLDQGNCRIYSLARHAIWNALRSHGFGADDVILVPAYHHGSEIEAIIQAGLNLRYYELTDMLEPDAAILQSLFDSRVRALYLIHYLGFPQNAAYWRQWCDERGIMLIEDAAQAFLATRDNRPVGSFGHMAFFCLYKMFGIPDGSVVVSDHPPAGPLLKAQSGYWRVFKRHVNFIAARNRGLGFFHLSLKPLVIKGIRKWNVAMGNSEFALGDPNSPPTLMTKRLLPKVLDKEAAARRRENYNFLLRHLGNWVPGPFATLPEGACPFAFPMKLSNPRPFLKEIRSKGVLGILFWLNPHPSLPVNDFPKSMAYREKVLALPVHQDLTRSNLQQIVDVVLQALKKHQSMESHTNELFAHKKQDAFDS